MPSLQNMILPRHQAVEHLRNHITGQVVVADPCLAELSIFRAGVFAQVAPHFRIRLFLQSESPI